MPTFQCESLFAVGAVSNAFYRIQSMLFLSLVVVVVGKVVGFVSVFMLSPLINSRESPKLHLTYFVYFNLTFIEPIKTSSKLSKSF